MALYTLSIDLEARIAALQSGLDKAGQLTARSMQKIEARLNAVKAVAAAVGSAIASAFVLDRVAQAFNATVAGLDRLNDLADATGSSVELISALEDAAARTGTSLDIAGDAVVRLNKVLGEAKAGSEQATAIKAIGLSVKELRELDPVLALQRVALALSGYADDANKARLVQELFGKSVKDVAPLLKDMAEAGRLNATVTAEQAREAETFNKNLAALQKNASDFARTITAGLLPSLNKFFERLNSERGLSGFFADSLREDFLRARLEATSEAIDNMRGSAERARTILSSTPTSIFAKATLAEFRELQEQAAAYRKELDELLATRQPGRRPANEGGGTVNVQTPVLPDLVTVQPAQIKRLRDELNPFAAALRALEATDSARLRELEETLRQLFEIEAETPGTPDVAQALASVRREIEALSGKQLPDAGPTQAYLDAIASLQDTDVGRIQALSATLDELFKLRDTQLFGPEVDEAIERTRAKLQELEQPLGQISEFSRQAARNIQDAFGQSLEAAFENGGRRIEDIWKDMLKRLAAQAAAAQLSEALFGKGYGTTTTQVGGWAGSAWSWFQSVFGGARANGGDMWPGRAYLVGERGPEIVMPTNRGTVLPNGTLPGGGAQIDARIVVQGDASANTLRLIRAAQSMQAARLAAQGRY